ncbi:hypothetical protein [Streptomyces sp. NPDC088746]|uniref:hypothetical protein n=1 Tax=Streptomyces sp. NPDC088746 TaxID=3365885 RepID=UPI0038035B20
MDDDDALYPSDLIGVRLLGVSALVSRPVPALWLHPEGAAPVRFHAEGSTLSLTAEPWTDDTSVVSGPQDVALTHFVGGTIRSVREIRCRGGAVDHVCGLTIGFSDGEVRLLALDGELVVAHDRHLGAVEARLHEDVTLAQVVRTCLASPSQWDAWTTDDQYLYLRYRRGVGSVEQHPSEDTDTWDGEGSRLLTMWDDGTDGGEIALPDFLTAAGLRLAPDAEVSVLTSWTEKGRPVRAAREGDAAGAT